MQTFLPYPTFLNSLAALDNRRLGKQRVETLQLMSALLMKTGWRNHACTRMWRGYELALLEYQRVTHQVWESRSKSFDSCWPKTLDLYDTWGPKYGEAYETPPWLGDPELHLSHQSNLLRKDKDFYGPLFPGVSDNLPYKWPTGKE